MEIAGTQNSRDDRTSVYRSYGSLYHGASQSRKISIGLMVDSLDNWKPKTTNVHESALGSSEKTFRKLSSIGNKNEKEKEKAKADSKTNQIDQENNTSPWLSTKSTHPIEPTSEAIPFAKTTTKVYSRREGEEGGETEGAKGLPSATVEKEVAEDKRTEPVGSRQVLKMKLWEILGANSVPNNQASEAPEVGANDFSPEPRIKQKLGNAFKPKQNSDTIETDSQSPDHTIKKAVTRSSTRKKAAPKAPTSKTKKTRKPAPTKKSLEKNIFTFNDGQFGKVNEAVASGSIKSNEKKQGKKVSKVEARKTNFLEDFNAVEAQPKNGKSEIIKDTEKTSSIGNSKRNNQNSCPKNCTDFSGPEYGNKENGFAFLSAIKRGGKGSKRDSPRFRFSDKLISDEVQPEKDLSETIRGAKNASLLGNTVRSYKNTLPENNSTSLGAEKSHEKSSSLLSGMKRGRKESKAQGSKDSETTKVVKMTSTDEKRTSSHQKSPQENNNKFVDTENRDNDKDSSLLATKKKLGHSSFLKTPYHWDQQEAFDTSPLKKTMDPDEDLQSPIFVFRTPAEKLDDQSPENCSFNTPLNSEPVKYTPDTGTRKSISSSDPDDSEDSPLTKTRHTRTEKAAQEKFYRYRSSPEKSDSESPKEGWATELTSPDLRGSRNPVLHPTKKLRSQENSKFQRFNPILASSEDLEEDDGFQGPSEENKENGFAKAISLLALALQRVQSQIKSVTSKKSTEILMAVAEEIHLQLQNAESEFERDVGKLKSLNKSKRKQLETEFEEQQEQLKVIYQKFKEDVSQHIQENMSKVEGLQGQEKELRLFMEKRKASQREVLKQLEGSIQVQLSDAEKRIAAVCKAGQEKMLQLKQALGNCLKEGMLG